MTDSIDQLGDRISELAAHISAATCTLLDLIREFDEREGWGYDGANSCAHWLGWRCGMDRGAARERVRVAHAIATLPNIHGAFASGQVSYSKVRAMTRVATPENEAYLLELARHGTAGHMERIVRAYRNVQDIEALELANDQHARRNCEFRIEEDGMWTFRARLTPEEGERLSLALERTMRDMESEGCADVSAETPYGARRADALTRLASTGADTEVVIHVSAEGQATLEDGPALCTDTAQRLACDAGIVRLTEDADGEPLNVGRRTRSVPPALRRALNARDNGCRFPGCRHTRHLHAHHIRHWADGGETSLANLVLVCHFHHRKLHEGGFGVVHVADGALRFTRPDGGELPDVPAPHALHAQPDAALAARNYACGHAIDAHTGDCLWDGGLLDMSMAIEGLLQDDGKLEVRVSAETRWDTVRPVAGVQRQP